MSAQRLVSQFSKNAFGLTRQVVSEESEKFRADIRFVLDEPWSKGLTGKESLGCLQIGLVRFVRSFTFFIR
jgi:hypothetical protein